MLLQHYVLFRSLLKRGKFQFRPRCRQASPRLKKIIEKILIVSTVQIQKQKQKRIQSRFTQIMKILYYLPRVKPLNGRCKTYTKIECFVPIWTSSFDMQLMCMPEPDVLTGRIQFSIRAFGPFFYLKNDAMLKKS